MEAAPSVRSSRGFEGGIVDQLLQGPCLLLQKSSKTHKASRSRPFTMEMFCRMAIQGEPIYLSAYRPPMLTVGFSEMIFNVRKQISYLSQGTTLEAGSIFLTGTPAGVGFIRSPKVVLKDGGDIRVSISQIGTLINRVRYDFF